MHNLRAKVDRLKEPLQRECTCGIEGTIFANAVPAGADNRTGIHFLLAEGIKRDINGRHRQLLYSRLNQPVHRAFQAEAPNINPRDIAGTIPNMFGCHSEIP